MLPLIGIIDIAVGSKDHYVSSDRLKNKDIPIEDAEAELRYHRLKVLFGAVRMVTFGVSYGVVANVANKPLDEMFQVDALSVGLLACYAMGHVMNGLYAKYKGVMKEESINERRYQGEILKNIEIFNKILDKTDLSIYDSYSLFLKGNKLANDFPIPEMVKKMKATIIEFKNKWTTEYYEIFKSLTKEVLKALNENTRVAKILEQSKKITNEVLNIFIKKDTVISLLGKLDKILKKMSDDKTLKENSKNLIKLHTDYNTEENSAFREYIRTNDTFKVSQSNKTICNNELKKINKDAIIQSYEFMRRQNIELFFAKVVLDYNKGIIHKDIINQFAELHNNTKLTEKGERQETGINSYKNISKIAIRMRANENVYSKNTDVKVILNHINPNLVLNGKIKIYSFNDVFESEKMKIIKKEMNTPYNNIKEKKINFNELEIDNKSFNEIVKITEKKLNQEKKVAEKIQEAKKNKI